MTSTQLEKLQKGLLSLNELAGKHGILSSTFWRMVHEHHIVEAPSYRIRNRLFYTPEQVKRVSDTIVALKEKGAF